VGAKILIIREVAKLFFTICYILPIFATNMGKRTITMRPNEQDTFMEMLARCERTVFKVCLLYTDRHPEHVRDLYQDIVCNLWQAWPRFRSHSTENTWVYRIALNTAVTQFRRTSRAPSVIRLTDEMYRTLAEQTSDPMRDRLYELIDRLNKADRALVLLVLDGFPYRDIASITGLREGAVRERVYRIKQRLINLNNNDNE